MYRLALSVARNEKDAEDIVQNAVLKIIKNIKGFRRQSRLSTWIYRITYNEALMHLRKKRRQFNVSEAPALDAYSRRQDLFVNWPKLPDYNLLDEEFKKRMDNAIKMMPIKYRMPVLLHNIEGLTLKDASSVLGLNLNSFKSRLHRSYLFLKSEISDYFQDKSAPKAMEDARCPLWIGLAHKYIDNALTGKTQAAFKEHINDCPGCKSFLDEYSRAIRITHALECRDIPLELQSKIKTFLKK